MISLYGKFIICIFCWKNCFANKFVNNVWFGFVKKNIDCRPWNTPKNIWGFKYLNCFWFFNLYMTSENTWRLCTNHGWFWIQFTVNCAFEIMIKILCHWTVTKRPMNLRMNLLHTCDVMYNLYTSQLLSRLGTVPWSIFYWDFQPLLILWIEVSYLEMKKRTVDLYRILKTTFVWVYWKIFFLHFLQIIFN